MTTTSMTEDLARSVEEYYRADPEREEKLQRILRREAGFSLREIDWYVTNMSARRPQVFKHPKTGRVVDVNSDYKDVLRCYHKSVFDSFRRKGDGDAEKELKQRNFFRWALENGIVDRVESSIGDIKDDMVKMKKHRGKRLKYGAVTFVQEPKELMIPDSTNVIW